MRGKSRPRVANANCMTKGSGSVDARRVRFSWPRRLAVIGLALAAVLITLIGIDERASASDDGSDEIRDAMYSTEEFFGSQALVPLPAAEARSNLEALMKRDPRNVALKMKLARTEEGLGNFESAEEVLKQAVESDRGSYAALASFYQRRGRYEDQASVFEKMFRSEKDAGRRAELLSNILSLARKHRIGKYLDPGFYDESALSGDKAFPVFLQLVQEFNDESDFGSALDYVKKAQKTFDGHKDELLDIEVAALENLKRGNEAEAVYLAAFDPAWSDERSDAFYAFLSRRDRLRDYGRELKAKFAKDPSNFDVGIRLAHYRAHDYESAAPVMAALESHKSDWTPEELTAAAKILLSDGEGDLASRFLYTLLRSPKVQSDPEARRKVLYQLFEVFSDAERSRLSLAPGGLGSYADIARTDTDPGISSGLLSLVFADADPGDKFAEKQEEADRLYNREAAFRLFSEYRKEFGTSPQLAQMYLDLIRLYTATGDSGVAEELLEEFGERHEKTDKYAEVALRLADAFEARSDLGKAEKICAKVLERLGQDAQVFRSAPPSESGYAYRGISIPSGAGSNISGYSYYDGSSRYKDFLDTGEGGVTYSFVLDKLVDLLSREKKTLDILSLYSKEIRKHPDSEWLYEERIKWLEQTNLSGEQFDAYGAALKRFKTNAWREKLARYLLRHDRRKEFEAFSEKVADTLDDSELSEYLASFEFEPGTDQLTLALSQKLYESALNRFPLNLGFARGLITIYEAKKDEKAWMDLASRYFFVSDTIREAFLDRLSSKGRLREYLSRANGSSDAYLLFRAEADKRLSNFEEAYSEYTVLATRHPDNEEFARHAKNIARSFGQTDRAFREQAARYSEKIVAADRSSAEAVTESGEIFAELGDFDSASDTWEGLITAASGSRDAYLDNATVNWDYYQFGKARRAIERIRELENDDTLYSFETGAILESENDLPGAVAEYVKALDTKLRDEGQSSKARKRLISLSRRGGKNAGMIESAFQKEHAARGSAEGLTLGYAEVLAGAGEKVRSAELLNAAIKRSRNTDFISEALDYYESEEDPSGTQQALSRLADVAESPRKKISYSFRLADSFRESRSPEQARNTLSDLVYRYPDNYGVIVEAASFYRRLGYDDAAVNTLKYALLRARGGYRLKLARQLAQTEVEMGRLDEAAEILERLHKDFDHDPEIFRALAAVYVRQKRPEALRKAFRETLDSLGTTGAEPIYIRRQIYSLRREMVDAFTQLGDPDSALDQYIEIINRNVQETAELTDGAIAYAQRYGGIDKLIRYYTKLSNESFKNYRWNLVLAKLYESQGKLELAVRNMNLAVANEPGDGTLFVRLSNLEAARGRYAEALKAIDRAIDLSGEDTEKTQTKIALLRKLGKSREAEELAGTIRKNAAEENPFDEAAAIEDAALALEKFRKAFETVLRDPTGSKLKVSDLQNYVKARRNADGLGSANNDLWELRGKLLTIAKARGAKDAQEARNRLSIVDSAITGSIGSIAKERAGASELSDLFKFLSDKMNSLRIGQDPDGTLDLVRNLANTAGLGKLEEDLLAKNVEESSDMSRKKAAVNDLAAFYEERGAYRKLAALFLANRQDDLSGAARMARLNGDQKAELEALARIYLDGSNRYGGNDADIKRYLTILYDSDRKRLSSLAETNSPHQMQLINFLLAKGEKSLVHKAISASGMPEAWKAARNAEASLALKEFSAGDECYFCAALNLDTIGKMTKQDPDKNAFLINDDWFRLASEYGEWLEGTGSGDDPQAFLPAMTENRPKDASEQLRLGKRHLARREFTKALDHLEPARELQPKSAEVNAYLGTALFLSGRKDDAVKIWKAMGLETDPNAAAAYLHALEENGLHEKMLSDGKNLLRGMVNSEKLDNEEIGEIVRTVAGLVTDDAERVAFFKALASRVNSRKALIRLVVNDSLVPEAEIPDLLNILIDSEEPDTGSDYSWTAILRRGIPDRESAETAFDQETGYGEPDEPYGDRFQAQRQLLEMLCEQDRLKEANEVAKSIERELSGRWARPVWLRLRIIRIGIGLGEFDGYTARSFIGIETGSAPLATVRPPSVERLNGIARALDRRDMKAESAGLRRDFYARMLALADYDRSNFAGLARAYFDLGDGSAASKTLRLLADTFDLSAHDKAVGELGKMQAIADARPTAGLSYKTWTGRFEDSVQALETAAETADVLSLTQEAIAFRIRKRALNPIDSSNRFKLGELLASTGKSAEAKAVWNAIVTDPLALRPVRWSAIAALKDSGNNVSWSVADYDAYSMQFDGALKEKAGKFSEAADSYTAALIADRSVQTATYGSLVRLFALNRREFAALTLYPSVSGGGSDELKRTVSKAAEQIGNYQKALEIERSTTRPVRETIERLEAAIRKQAMKFTDFEVDPDNTARR